MPVGESARAGRKACGEHTSVDSTGGVSSAYRRLPQPLGADPSVKCCRNKPMRGGVIDWNVTLEFSARAMWPSACEGLCTDHSSGRCRFFSHSVTWQRCILCTACVPEIMIGDDSFASFQRATEDPARLYEAKSA